ncbi:two-component system, response regulator, stage 0 sporulation protein F [Salinibacillus kushneri]|uniref:Two-component system, response regulator, stage 0 sporulation protein F n=1 Tax=Salinibacillus kushneri TaxID=237682 RepID=A0A1I0CUI7_9BACI|nr:response regulator [Salinibacillus kushneri]SET23462.1 two-component system, response regulator, stage 0 sporulation protein F [Salinibacillus kushneri]
MDKEMMYIVDDQLGIRLLLREIILDAGFEVKEFENGKEMLEECEALKPAFVFVDYNMPVMNGRHIAEELDKRFGDEVGVCIMSGFSIQETDFKDAPSNIKEFLEKPFDVAEVKTLLKQYVS